MEIDWSCWIPESSYVLPVKEISRSIIEWVGGRGTSTDMISPGAMCTIYHILMTDFSSAEFSCWNRSLFVTFTGPNVVDDYVRV